MNHQETVKLGATMRQALHTINEQEKELNLLRTEVHAYRASLNVKGNHMVDNTELKDNIEMELHKLSESMITNQTEMECAR